MYYLPLNFKLPPILLLVAISSQQAAAQTPGSKAVIEGLYKNVQWLSLGHYVNKGFNHWESEIDDPGFFISVKGKLSPEEELTQTIKALESKDRQKFACQYPARYLFLKRHMPNLRASNLKECTGLQKWKKNYSADSVSLIFPGSHVSSPSSVFGHTFLRFDRNHVSTELSPSVEFSALVDSNKEGMFSYLKKGLTGGFRGIYSFKPYYVKTWEYSDIENRNIWEYKLDFNRDQANFLLLHLWELRGHYLDYYFLDENCSYQILALLSVADPALEFRQSFPTTALPSETIKYLNEAGVIVSDKFIPSNREKVDSVLSKLIGNNRLLLDRLISEKTDLNTEELNEAIYSQLFLTLQAANDILIHQIQRQQVNQKFALKRVKEITNIQLLDKEPPSIIEIDVPPDLTDSHAPKRIGVNFRNRNDEDFVIYKFRLAYHGFTDVLAGFPKNTEIEVLNLELIEREGDVGLNDLTLINLRTMIPVSRYSKQYSWGLQIRRKRVFLDPTIEPINQINYDIGKTVSLGATDIYLLGGTGLSYQSIENKGLNIHAGIKTGLLLQRKAYSLHLELQLLNMLGNEQLNYQKAVLIFSYSLGKNIALNTHIEVIDSKLDESETYGLGISWYF